MKTLLLSLSLLAAPSLNATNLIVCGTTEVTVINREHPYDAKWSWTAADSPSIPESFRARFRSTDECKPYTGDFLLITSSSGGVALIDRNTKKCLFLTRSSNAHSACLLPDNQIVVAASYGGDEMQFFDLSDKRRPAVAAQALPCHGAHGALWDANRKTLWALGGDELMALRRQDGCWHIASRHPLPTPGGHDLSPAHNGRHLFITSNSQVLLFDRDSAKFAVHPLIGGEPKVKSVDLHPDTGLTVFHQGTAGTWWSDTIRFVGGATIRLKDRRLYKVRWDIPIPRP